MSMHPRWKEFVDRHALRAPILQAPMAGVPAVPLARAVVEAGGMAAFGGVLSSPAEIAAWMDAFRDAGGGPAQINLWVPDPPPARDAGAEARTRAFLGEWGPPVPVAAGDAVPADFDAQFDVLLAARPAVASSIMGLFRPDQVERLRAAGIAWFACATTAKEALAAQAAGADAVVAQGAEAGGHRGSFDAAKAESQAVGLFALLPRLVDVLEVPVIAAGGIGDGRGIAAALALGASAVQIGTALLRSPEAAIPVAWQEALADAGPERTMLTRAFSGRAGRALDTAYVRAAVSEAAPPPRPYPVQRALTGPMRTAAAREGRIDAMQAWAGQGAWLARSAPAQGLVEAWWREARALLA